VTAGDAPADEDFYGRLADWLEAGVDLEALLLLPPVQKGGVGGFDPDEIPLNPPLLKGEVIPRVKIAVARDEAFCFCYPENLELLQAVGAEIVPFSPLHDPTLPPGIDGLYLPGGYPELHAEQLAQNEGLIREIREAAVAGLPVYAECGGLIYLTQGIVGADPCACPDSGEHAGSPLYRLLGIFPAVARMLPQRKALGYREVTFSRDTILGPARTVARGHEFHYSEIVMPPGIARVYHLTRADGTVLGEEGFVSGNVLGSYVHLHFGSNPQVAANFVNFCLNNRCHRGTETQR
jgi:cobyrinic acid a,c-diamide synthase